MEDNVVERTLPAGTVIKVDNIPFEVVSDVRIRGTAGNFDLVRTHVGAPFPWPAEKKPAKKKR